MQFKLTFNKPAFKMFFEGEDSKGLAIRVVDDGQVQFRPVATDEGPDTATISMRGRGGIEASIEGSASDTIMKHLKNPHGYPYFMLNRAPKGWIKATPFDGPGEPPRFQPQVRVWLKDSIRPLPLHLIHDVKQMDVANFVQELRTAKATIEDYSVKKKVGRPPAEVTEARAKLKLFADVARDVLPLNGLWKAYISLGRYLGATPVVPNGLDIDNDDIELLLDDEMAAPAVPALPAPAAKKGRPRKVEDDKVVVSSRKKAADPETERLVKSASAKLGLAEDTKYMPPKKKIAGKR